MLICQIKQIITVITSFNPTNWGQLQESQTLSDHEFDNGILEEQRMENRERIGGFQGEKERLDWRGNFKESLERMGGKLISSFIQHVHLSVWVSYLYCSSNLGAKNGLPESCALITRLQHARTFFQLCKIQKLNFYQPN